MILEHADDPFGDDGGPAAGDVLIDDLEEGVLRRLQRLVDADLLRRRRHQVAGVGVVDLVGRRLQLERRVDWNTGTAGRRQRRRGRRRRIGRRGAPAGGHGGAAGGDVLAVGAAGRATTGFLSLPLGSLVRDSSIFSRLVSRSTN